MSHTGKDVTWNRLFRSDPNFAKDGKGRTITGDYDRGWYAALDAAREAVAALCNHNRTIPTGWCCGHALAAAAIDDLRERND